MMTFLCAHTQTRLSNQSVCVSVSVSVSSKDSHFYVTWCQVQPVEIKIFNGNFMLGSPPYKDPDCLICCGLKNRMVVTCY